MEHTLRRSTSSWKKSVLSHRSERTGAGIYRKSAGTSLLTELPEYGSADGNADSGTYMDGEEQALVKQIDLFIRMVQRAAFLS